MQIFTPRATLFIQREARRAQYLDIGLEVPRFGLHQHAVVIEKNVAFHSFVSVIATPISRSISNPMRLARRT